MFCTVIGSVSLRSGALGIHLTPRQRRARVAVQTSTHNTHHFSLGTVAIPSDLTLSTDVVYGNWSRSFRSDALGDFVLHRAGAAVQTSIHNMTEDVIGTCGVLPNPETRDQKLETCDFEPETPRPSLQDYLAHKK